jgi:hypothetical protein
MIKWNEELKYIQLYLPSGLNLGELLFNINNSTELSSLEKEWALRISRLKQGSKTCKNVQKNVGKLILFITLLLWLGYTNDFCDKKGSHPIGQRKLKKYFRDAEISLIRNILEKLGIIRVLKNKSGKASYQAGIKPMVYRLSRRLRYSSPVPVVGNFSISPTKSRNWKKNWNRNPENEFEEWLCYNVEEVRILPEAIEAIPYFDYSDDPHKDIVAAQRFVRNSVKKIRTFDREENKQILFNRDRNVKRVYTNVTGMKSESRQYLRHRGKKIAVIDLNASHPFWLNALYQSKHLKNSPKATAEAFSYNGFWRIGDNDFYANMAKELEFPEDRGRIKRAFFEEFLYVKKPFGKFGKKLDEFYKQNFPILHKEMRRLRSKACLPYWDEYWRKNSVLRNTEIKLLVCSGKVEMPKTGKNIAYIALIDGQIHIKILGYNDKILFDKAESKIKGKKQELKELKSALKEFWDQDSLPKPKINELRDALGEITGLVKLNGQLAVENMRIESSAFIDGAAQEIFDGEKFWIITIHDAIGCDLENVGKVKEILTRHIKARTGFEPVLKTEILGNDVPVLQDVEAPEELICDNRDVSNKFKVRQKMESESQESVIDSGIAFGTKQDPTSEAA